jgi:Spy/CpxP family protein refolding chaperone
MCRHPHPHSHHHARCGCDAAGAGPARTVEHHHYPGAGPGGLGVRRPLRFLAWKLGLSEAQLTEFATVLNALKTERAQGEVDDRRALALLADGVESDPYDPAKATEAGRLRSESAARLQQSIAAALARMHVLLEPEQRRQLAYLLRAGTLLM